MDTKITGLDFDSYKKIQKEVEQLSRKKNHDYGSESLITFGNYGILIRLSDKFDRLKSLYKNGKQQKSKVEDEKIEDTLKDIINYATYIIMQSRGKLVKNEKGGKND